MVDIYIVEDDSSLGEMLEMTLDKCGYKISVFNNIKDFYDVEKKNKPDIMIVEKDMDGLEITKDLRRNPLTRNIPIVVMGKGSRAMGEEEALRAGADMFLHEPVSVIELIARVCSLAHKVAERKSNLHILNAS